MNITQQKAALRQLINDKRIALSDAERLRQSRQVCELLSEFWQRQDGASAVIYLATPNEVNIDEFIVELQQAGVAVWAPMGNTFARLNSLNEVRIGHWGSREPLETSALPPQNALIFVPGFAFDHKGNRVGHGAGWYDRVLTDFPDALKIGVAFDFQVVSDVPRNEHDVAIDGLVSPGGIWLF